MNIEGRSRIGRSFAELHNESFQATNPATGEPLPGVFHHANASAVDRAARLAESAFAAYGNASGKAKGTFLRAIADNLDSAIDVIKARAVAETGLPEARIAGELARTTGQLRMFAALVEEGSWVDARIDHALPDRKPLPRPDVRAMLKPIGPVAIFCASNFPLAFSVAGGDTASALAAGCPVVVMAHHAHPGTASIVASQIAKAVESCGLHEGVFSILFGPGRKVGQELVRHPAIRAVGFTGSRAGGRALFDIAAARPEPIPVYAEMSSINPVFLLPGALRSDPETLAQGLVSSLTLGVGQFCTNPGLVLTPNDPAAVQFREIFKSRVEAVPPATMLHSGIRDAYERGVERKAAHTSVRTLARVPCPKGKGASAAPAVFLTDASSFMRDPNLAEEVFGPSTLLVEGSAAELKEIASNLEGHLTASLFGTPEDLEAHAELVEILRRKVGRLIFNQFPTGVEVCPAMVHGGPYPATTDGRSTSVGTAAILRFTRYVCYQNFPQPMLPDELKDANPLRIFRIVNGERQR